MIEERYSEPISPREQAGIDAMDKHQEELEAEGHTAHCAARQVWGDGKCECGLKKQTIERR
jgi:hypothetical protein